MSKAKIMSDLTKKKIKAGIIFTYLRFIKEKSNFK